MIDGLNLVASFCFGALGTILWVLFGVPYKCAGDLPGQERTPALEDYFGRACDTETVLGIPPILASEEAALLLTFPLGVGCFAIAAVLSLSSDGSGS